MTRERRTTRPETSGSPAGASPRRAPAAFLSRAFWDWRLWTALLFLWPILFLSACGQPAPVPPDDCPHAILALCGAEDEEAVNGGVNNPAPEDEKPKPDRPEKPKPPKDKPKERVPDGWPEEKPEGWKT